MSGDVLSDKELERYDRQLRIPKIGRSGQLKLKKAKVLVAGVGGLGTVASIYLARAGVGKLILVDNGAVELSNLNRQILYDEDDVGKEKAVEAAEKLRRMNPDIEAEPITETIRGENVESLVSMADLVVDGQDNFKTRFLLNDACVKLRKPFIHAAIYMMEGRLMTIIPGKGPCLRCLLPIEPPELGVIPILGPAPGVMGCLEALEAIKLITGVGKPAVGRLIIFDGEELSFDQIPIKRNPGCPVCGEK